MTDIQADQVGTETAQERYEARKPDFKTDGVSVWINTRKDGKRYVSIQMPGHTVVYVNENK